MERNISATIASYILGERGESQEVRTVFDDGILTHMSFDRRINAFLLIVPHPMPAEDIRSLRSHLSEFRRTRNAMAHNPFWFRPIINEAGHVEDLVPMILRGKRAITLTSEFVQALNESTGRLIAQTQAIAIMAAKRSRAQ